MFLHGNHAGVTAIGVVLLTCLALPARAVPIPSESEYVQSLDGIWRLKMEQVPAESVSRSQSWDEIMPIETPETFEPFYALNYTEDDAWHDVTVPGNWEMAGFSPATYNEPDNSSAFYRKSFEVPASWEGRLVRINFDGVQTGAEVWLNGRPVQVTEPSWERENYHESGWTAWQADLTPHVRFGKKNLLAIRVCKSTKSSSLDSGDYFYLGGIHRTVTLFSVPSTHIQDVTVRTALLSGDKAEVKVIANVGGMSAETPRVSMRLGDSESPVEGEPDAEGAAEITQIVSRPRLWSAEHPNLYLLTIELKDSKGKVIETVTRRIGIREVSIKKGVLLVNGTPVKLAGMCRHDVYLSMGTAVDEEVWRKDLTLMKAANVNAVRTSHYPYGAGFYDLCDEMGFYVVDELPYCWCPTDDPELKPAFLQRARETIARDKNHPCVIIWGIGNENRSGRNLQTVADLVKESDSTRPRLVSCKPADEYGTDFDDSHYTQPEIIRRSAEDSRREKWPKIYTENPNVWDARLGADYGCLDLWAAVLQRTWAEIWDADGIPGSFLWEWQDRAVRDKCPVKLYEFDPATGVQYFKTKGVVDGWRHPRPEYYHVKMVYAPIKVDAKIDLTSKPGSAILSAVNHYSFTDLSELKANWQLLREGAAVDSGTARLKLAPRTSGDVELPLPADSLAKADALRIDFDDPRGWNVVSYQFRLTAEDVARPPTKSTTPPSGLAFPTLNLVSNVTKGDPAKWRVITRYRGSLVNVQADPASSEDLYARPLAGIRSVDADIVLDKDPAQVVGRLHAEYADGRFSYRIEWTGEKADIQELGWIFEVPRKFERFSWRRQALWTIYPATHIGRPTGAAHPDSADVYLTNVSRPDAFDFNSTKYNCDWATLTDTSGHGLRIEFAADQRHHVRGGFGPKWGYTLIVNRQCSPPRDISTHTVPDLYLELKPGARIEGAFWVESE